MADYDFNTNYEASVPAEIRGEITQRLDQAERDRLIHPDAGDFVRSIVMFVHSQAKPPIAILVEIPGLDAPHAEPGTGYNHHPRWLAKRGHGATPPIYKIEGDPNAVAVGRFKASLRKFLGLS